MAQNNCLDNLRERAVLADTHVHLHSEEYEGKLDLVWARAINAGVKEIWLVAVDGRSAEENISIVSKYSPRLADLKLRLGIGFDMELLVPGSDLFTLNYFSYSPEKIGDWVYKQLEQLANLAEESGLSVDMIGEIGLDHYWTGLNYKEGKLSRKELEKSHELQLAMFKSQLRFAGEKGLPVSIHSRAAEAVCVDVVAEIKREYPTLNGIFHSYTGPVQLFEKIQALGFVVGVNGIATYKSADWLKGAVKRRVPEKSLSALYQAGFVLETDAPYLIPANCERSLLAKAYGETINDPATVADTLEFLFN